jgi:alpha-mannosidase
MKKPLILVCNSHIDPVWLWEWEEGIAETLSTFRTAVRFCEGSGDFVFCHNESLLYEWTEKFDPPLFERIRTQVKKGLWNIMGGWYLQPDCNMLLGESVIRQIITGKQYFIEKFGKEPSTAINFDSFGHSRGLVQLLADAGYDSYLFCRPDKKYLELPGDTFQWIGFDGSSVTTHRADDHYNSQFGHAGEKLLSWIANPVNLARDEGILLWGIGNHGGGPSAKDIVDISVIKEGQTEWDIRHGNPEEYFSLFSEKRESIPVFKGDLNPFAIGCYSSMKSIKQALYRLEHKYYFTERILGLAAFAGKFEYPEAKMEEALKELLFCQFHDILPGSSVEPVEKDVLNRLGHSTRIIEEEMASFFIKTSDSLKPAQPGEFPLMLLNPHPFGTDCIIETELQLPEPNRDPSKVRTPFVFDENDNPVPVQSEKPVCNIKDDHRKRIVFRAKIGAGEVKRYSCFLNDITRESFVGSAGKEFRFSNERSRLLIDESSGFPREWEFAYESLLSRNEMRFNVVSDNADPWGMNIKSFEGDSASFILMTKEQVSEFSGIKTADLDPVYISEKGTVRTIVESLFAYNNSRIHLRYIIPSDEPGFDAEITVYWMEKDKLLKWMIPVGFNMNCVGRSISGINCFKHRKREFVFRDWLGMKNFEGKNSFSICSDGAYGFDINGNNVGITLLRAPSYSGHPVEGQQEIICIDRAVKRMDQGVHTFRFRFTPGETEEIINNSFNQSDLFNNPVTCRVVYPKGEDTQNYSGIRISDNTINLQAVKFDNNSNLVIRLLNPCKVLKRFKIEVPSIRAEEELCIKAKQLKTWIIDRDTRVFRETDLLERDI